MRRRDDLSVNISPFRSLYLDNRPTSDATGAKAGRPIHLREPGQAVPLRNCGVAKAQVLAAKSNAGERPGATGPRELLGLATSTDSAQTDGCWWAW